MIGREAALIKSSFLSSTFLYSTILSSTLLCVLPLRKCGLRRFFSPEIHEKAVYRRVKRIFGENTASILGSFYLTDA